MVRLVLDVACAFICTRFDDSIWDAQQRTLIALGLDSKASFVFECSIQRNSKLSELNSLTLLKKWGFLDHTLWNKNMRKTESFTKIVPNILNFYAKKVLRTIALRTNITLPCLQSQIIECQKIYQPFKK